MRLSITLIGLLFLTACSLQPALVKTQQDIQVEVSDGVWVDLPKPGALKQTLNVRNTL